MQIDPVDVGTVEFYRHLVTAVTPRPIAWVSSVDQAGRPNLAPFSFFNAIGANPPVLSFSPVNRRDGTAKDTLENIRSTRQFVLHIVPHRLAESMNLTSAELPPGQSEFEYASLASVPSERVAPPRLAEAPIAFECHLHSIVSIGDGPLAANLVIGLIALMHIDPNVQGPDGLADPELLDSIGRLGRAAYSRTRDRFDLPRPD